MPVQAISNYNIFESTKINSVSSKKINPQNVRNPRSAIMPSYVLAYGDGLPVQFLAYYSIFSVSA